ncbi:MAG: hypothetical protein COA71_14000 [SAR86 cluster bacterium]|uniref:Rieske domain-containing protein n=1 Tax=SAR86 cluster bacterium TaxID=2030880 RepID=A0A2A5C7L9_9GAMM|nr:Rieske 2Fe-2S domain-containing protein [Gammaproteobacteria bacterium AH-315-E17]PCJ39376.1 MAG: hypothetical protein COA71_14000 [SAR86 cluster bacterium]
MSAKVVKLCNMDQLADGTSRGFDPLGEGRDTLFIVRRGKVVKAYINSCPHWHGAPMAWRKDAYLTSDKKRIACYGHEAEFDIENGECLSGPCLGQSLTALPIHVSLNNTLYLLLKDLQHKNTLL